MKNTNFDCQCLIENQMGAVVWSYHCVRRDRRIALSVHYAPEARHISPPVLHKLTPIPDCDDICRLLQSPCEAIALMSGEQWTLLGKHPGTVEPGLPFWQVMMQIIEAQGVPWLA